MRPAVAEWSAESGETRVLIHPEFRAPEALRTDLLALKIPGLRVELVGAVASRTKPLGDSRTPITTAYRLLLIGPAGAVATARSHAEHLDAPTPLVSVSVLLSEATLSSANSRGASLLYDKDGVGDPKGTLFRSFDTGFDPDSYLVSTLTGARPFEGTTMRLGDPNVLGGAWESALRMLAKRGEAQFLAWPNLMVAEGRPAEIEAVENLPHVRLDVAGTNPFARLDTETVGLRMRVTAVHVGAAAATLDIDLWLALPESPEGASSFSGGLRVTERQVRTRISVRDGEPLLIGGLFLRRHNKHHKGLPGLVGVSLVDALLSADDRSCIDTELLVLVRARVKTPTLAEIRARKTHGPVISLPATDEQAARVERGTDDPFEDSWRPHVTRPGTKNGGAPKSSADLDVPPGG